MNDRELLELAAKAAGIEIEPHPNRGIVSSLQFIAEGKSWNPLADDGDAFRLAVRLGIPIHPNMRSNTAGACTQRYNFEERHNGDAFAATRRAIVRAAAKIGEGGDKA